MTEKQAAELLDTLDRIAKSLERLTAEAENEGALRRARER